MKKTLSGTFFKTKNEDWNIVYILYKLKEGVEKDISYFKRKIDNYIKKGAEKLKVFNAQENESAFIKKNIPEFEFFAIIEENEINIISTK